MGYSVKFVACIKLIGLTLIGIGIWYRVDPKMYEPTNYIGIQSYIVAAWIMMITGLIIVIFAFIGCFGAANDSTSLLCFYFVTTSIVCALQITCIVLACAHGFGDQLEEYVSQQVILHVQQRQFNDKAREFLDFVQVKLDCCGAFSFNDYHKYGQDIPVSCGGEKTNFVHREGCGRIFRRFIDLRAGIIVGLCAIAAMFQLSAIVAAVSIYCAIKHAEYGD
ncbi:CD9 antigen-like protein [Leptotrombidium deliense]|uniref:Tetraspanin n=1 Tax=Leptotrombidium deliense TaxID=299467 RepID=A0A443SED5_9ACAR|nr:CD9 antigen-like protein [Leptotrombidium deliense]